MFGATGYTGGLVARALVAAGTRPVLAGRAALHRPSMRTGGPRVAGRAALLTAFGYDYVPGNLAGPLALAEAGERVTLWTLSLIHISEPTRPY